MEYFFGKEEWLKAASYYLRYQVFVMEQEILAELEFDGKDAYYPNLLFFKNNQPIATLRYQNQETNRIQFERFCVAKDFRKQGIGQKMLDFAENKAKTEGYTEAFLIAELTAVPFYEKQGYISCSQPFLEDGILCIEMQKPLKNR
ncbi:GNAT family N-acetyltransferase [Enterococcus hirae]|nr:GNAT family N-acetyltransferase [Enterococcus hirae]